MRGAGQAPQAPGVTGFAGFGIVRRAVEWVR